MLRNKNRENLEIVANGKLSPSMAEMLAMVSTFSLTVFAWIFFRAENLAHAFSFISAMLNGLLQKSAYIDALNFLFWKVGFALPVFIVFFFVLEWLGRENNFALKTTGMRWPWPIRWTFFSLLCMAILFYAGNEQEFIYFQF
jgi:alginate O-acetyltransferase complex protein AlgI